jgi:hypothetical protein
MQERLSRNKAADQTALQRSDSWEVFDPGSKAVRQEIDAGSQKSFHD